MLSTIETVLQQYVRPQLVLHHGDIQLLDYSNGTIRVRLLGACSNCPAALQTVQEIVLETVQAHVPQVRAVSLETGVSDELMEAARALMRSRGA
ncbi:NifU family protein [Clostridium minihomine]|uniref:NifU family protein n=1 Tax=Clostridium minihomine TaxID=2045012 RepID=UPI000C776132|nr:NifU family protein [Clostridium minihomine]